MLLLKDLTRGILVLSLGVLISLTGCARTPKIILHPIDKVDIQIMEKGKPLSPEKNGYFISDEYLKEVLKAKVD